MQPALINALIVVGIVVVVAAIVGAVLWSARKSLAGRAHRVDESWQRIEVQVRRRAELVPRIVEAVEGYAGHEKAAFQQVVAARDETVAARTPAEASAAEAHMQTSLKAVFAVADSFPQLQASQSFLALQTELVDSEDALQGARRSYNGGVREFNTKRRSFPGSVYARKPQFAERDFFEVTEPSSIAEPPRVQF